MTMKGERNDQTWENRTRYYEIKYRTPCISVWRRKKKQAGNCRNFLSRSLFSLCTLCLPSPFFPIPFYAISRSLSVHTPSVDGTSSGFFPLPFIPSLLCLCAGVILYVARARVCARVWINPNRGCPCTRGDNGYVYACVRPHMVERPFGVKDCPFVPSLSPRSLVST